jgi:hypothetical protein
LSITDTHLQANEGAMTFVKGKEYSWFGLGTAVNVGYVVFETNGEERIVEIIRSLSVDSL